MLSQKTADSFKYVRFHKITCKASTLKFALKFTAQNLVNPIESYYVLVTCRIVRRSSSSNSFQELFEVRVSERENLDCSRTNAVLSQPLSYCFQSKKNDTKSINTDLVYKMKEITKNNSCAYFFPQHFLDHVCVCCLASLTCCLAAKSNDTSFPLNVMK